MKILFWQWNAFMQKGIERAMEQLNIVYDKFFYQLNDWENDKKFDEEFRKQLKASEYNVVFSVNYNPLISDACEEFSIKYISWVYDSPIHIRNIESFNNSCNRIYFFDRGQMELYQSMGYHNVFYMPLAADEKVWEQAFSNAGKSSKQYECDVAFVGQLYQSDYSYLMGPLPQYERGMMDGIVNAQGMLYGAYILDQLIDDVRMNQLNAHYRKASNGKFQVQKAEMEYACACEVTGRERKMALALLQSRCDLHVHSGSDYSELTKVKNLGYVDYYSQMPLVFANAKINLNITLKTIRTGIPLRVLDIMSCGGFLITNYQEELLEYFEPDVDLVIYEDVKDLVRKVDYYLKNNEKRLRIAENGCKKVREYFSFEDRLRVML